MDKIDNKITEVTSDTMANPETEMFSYNFRVKLENGEDLKFRVPSNVIMMDSPLKGYKSANGTRPMLDTTNRLVYSPLDKSILRRLLILCGASLLVGLLIGAGVMFSIGKVSTIFDQNPGAPATVTEPEVEQPAEPVAEVKETKEEAAPVEVKADSAKAEEKPVEKQPVQPKQHEEYQEDEAIKDDILARLLAGEYTLYINENEYIYNSCKTLAFTLEIPM